MQFDSRTLETQRHELISRLTQQAELYLQHNVQECRSLRNIGNRWLFHCGMKQGVTCGVDFFFNKFAERPASDSSLLAQSLFEFKAKVIETSQLWPHQAIENWELTELVDRVDIEREDVINGLQHGLCAVGNNLPRLVKRMQTKRASLGGPSITAQTKI